MIPNGRNSGRLVSWLVTLVIIVSQAASPQAAASQLYVITDLGTLAGGPTAALGISNSGIVVGYSGTGSTYQPFVWSQSDGIHQIDTGSTESGMALGVNSTGTVVGYYRDTEGNQRAFSWTGEGGLSELTPPSATGAIAYGIDDSELIVGTVYVPSDLGGSGTAAIWENGNVQFVPTPAGYRAAVLSSNAQGDFVGMVNCTPSGCSGASPAYWPSGGSFQILPVGGTAYAINDAGTVVGAMSGSNGAWRWSAQEGVEYLPTLGGANAGAYDVNASGHVVGQALTPDGGSRAILWTPEGQLVDLSNQIANPSGWQFLQNATAVNDAGQIVGYGRAYIGPDGDLISDRAFLLTPVPIPAAAWLFGGAMAVLGIARRKIVQ